MYIEKNRETKEVKMVLYVYYYPYFASICLFFHLHVTVGNCLYFGSLRMLQDIYLFSERCAIDDQSGINRNKICQENCEDSRLPFVHNMIVQTKLQVQSR